MPVLVTRCGGPEETLAGIEDAAGELVAVEESDASLVDGYRRLRERFPAVSIWGAPSGCSTSGTATPAVARIHHRGLGAVFE